MASIDLNKTFGIVTEIGGKTSHMAIMARTMELPAVVELRDKPLFKTQLRALLRGLNRSSPWDGFNSFQYGTRITPED